MISYLDNAATTLPCKAAAEAMERATREIYGNPSSLHAMGLEAEKAVNEARAQVAAAMTKQKLADVKKPENKPRNIFYNPSFNDFWNGVGETI